MLENSSSLTEINNTLLQHFFPPGPSPPLFFAHPSCL